MLCLQLGVGAKVTILVSRLHRKILISRAYANYTKTDKVEGFVVVSMGVIVNFCHPLKRELTEKFDCWAIHCFAHITEEGDEEQLFTASNDGGDNNSGGVGGTQPNPNITHNTTHNNNEEAQTNEIVPAEIAQLLESNSPTLDSDDANIIEAWNANMTEQFTPSWVGCLDESMSTWMNRYSCPGWMFVP